MQDRRLPVVVIHGIGYGTNQDRAGFSTELSTDVYEAARPVTRVGAFEEVKVPSGDAPGNGIWWGEALWETVNDHTDKVTEELLKAAIPGPPADWFAKVLDLLGDVPLYLGPHGNAIRSLVKGVIGAFPDCIVVGHSLGSVIAADILREAQITDNFSSLPVSGLITLGSPLNLLGLRSPMAPAQPFPFRWYNLWYPTDPVTLGKALSPTLFPGVTNRKLSAGESFVVAHTSYWSSVVVANVVYQLSVKGGTP